MKKNKNSLKNTSIYNLVASIVNIPFAVFAFYTFLILGIALNVGNASEFQKLYANICMFIPAIFSIISIILSAICLSFSNKPQKMVHAKNIAIICTILNIIYAIMVSSILFAFNVEINFIALVLFPAVAILFTIGAICFISAIIKQSKTEQQTHTLSAETQNSQTIDAQNNQPQN